MFVSRHRSRYVAAKQRLHNEIRNDASTVGMHAWPIGVEDTSDFDAHLVLAPISEEQALRAALALIIARPYADRIDIAPVILGLRMNARIAIDTATRSYAGVAGGNAISAMASVFWR
jgi:hypothetical protein